jgi:hypothetical protein
LLASLLPGCGGGVVETALVTAIIGRVFDAITGDAIQNAVVRFMSEQGSSSRQAAEQGATDGEGYYRLENVPTGQGTLSITLPDGSYQRLDITIDVQGVTTLDVRLVPRDAVPGQLIVSVRNLPAQPIPVGETWQFEATTTADMDPVWMVRPVGANPGEGVIDSQGLFTALKEGTVEVVGLLSNDPIGGKPVTAVAGVTVSAGQAVITGRVVDRYGHYVEGATVRLGSLQTTTDAEGWYRLDGVPTGEQTITAEKDGQTGSVKATIQPGEGLVEVIVFGRDRSTPRTRSRIAIHVA